MKDFIKVMKALADPNRVKMIKLLQHRVLCVCEIKTALGVAQSTASKHLSLKWQALNIDKTENKHFIKDFQLYSKSVIIAEYRSGKPVRWENLKEIWQLSRDRKKYFDYLARSTRSFMEKN